MAESIDTVGLNRAGRRAAEKRARRMRTAGAALAAGAATFGTTAAIVGVTAGSAGATTLEVTNCNPTGAGSLHDVAEGAGNGDVVVFNTGGCNAIFLDDTINIDTSIQIQGPGALSFTVSGDTGNNGSANVQIFKIDGGGPAVNVTISGLTLTMGTASEGGAVQVENAATVAIRDSILTANHANNGGGAIEAADDQSNQTINLTIENSSVSGNTSSDWGGGLYFYGAGGTLTVTNSTFSQNTATNGGGGAWIGIEDSSASVTGTTISQNTAGDWGGGFSFFQGDVTVTGSTVTGNTSSTNEGGGLYFDSPNSVMIDSTTVTGNTAVAGGGVWVLESTGPVTISNSNISGNTATDGDGGGLYLDEIDGNLNITNTTISGNTATDGGGGGAWLYGIYGTNNNIIGSVISGNHANRSNGDGGGLYMGNFYGTTTIAFTTISGNTANGTGGAINWYSGDVLRILNTTISGNTGSDDGGGLYVASSTEGPVEIFNSTLSGNTTSGEGGAIHFASYYGLQIAQSTITGNTGATVGGIFLYCFDNADAAHASSGNGNSAHKAETTAKDSPHASNAPAKPQRAHTKKVHAHVYGDLSASGTIISGNTGADVGKCGTLKSDHSLIGSIVGTALTDQGGTILGQLPLVAPLGDNGGPTQTHALLPDSPAINAGPVPVATFEGNANDQRGEGFPRVVGPAVDIGAYEVQPPKPLFTG